MPTAHRDAGSLPRPLLAPGWTNAYVSPPVPFREHGRDPAGWDCWGLLRWVYQHEFGISLPSYAEGYESIDDHGGVFAVFEDQVRGWEETDDPRPGDVVWCAFMGFPCHVGVYAGAGTMLHVMPKRNTVVERIDGPAWQHRIRTYFRHRLVRFTP